MSSGLWSVYVKVFTGPSEDACITWLAAGGLEHGVNIAEALKSGRVKLEGRPPESLNDKLS